MQRFGITEQTDRALLILSDQCPMKCTVQTTVRVRVVTLSDPIKNTGNNWYEVSCRAMIENRVELRRSSRAAGEKHRGLVISDDDGH